MTLLIGLLMVLALSVVDYVSGSEISFSIFYLAPILYVTWFAGRPGGVLVAVIAAVTWGVVDVAAGARYSTLLIPVWNSAVRFGFFALSLGLLGELHRVHLAALAMAHTDTLTGVGNTRSFYMDLEREVKRQRRYGRPFALAYVDLDNFKDVNDTLGHAAGDELLRELARVVVSTMRDSDIVARLGGDEFAILMPEADEEMATIALARMRNAIRTVTQSAAKSVPDVDATIGAVVFSACPVSADAAVKLADDLMYQGKRSGRGVVKLAVHNLGNEAGDASSGPSDLT
jgi:diguanylate cyclase (GGDEF)-like protein